MTLPFCIHFIYFIKKMHKKILHLCRSTDKGKVVPVPKHHTMKNRSVKIKLHISAPDEGKQPDSWFSCFNPDM
jgi:hypothetical protein